MLITCTNCGTSYQVTPSSLGPAGRSVRCARCQHVWFAANTEAMADVAETHRADLEAIAETPHVPDAPPPAPGFEQAAVPIPDPGMGTDVAPEAEPGMGTDVAPEAAPALAHDGAEPPPEPPAMEGEAASQPVIAAPPLAPPGPAPSPAAAEPEDIESVAARRASRLAAQRRRWRRSTWTTAILTLLAINLVLISWRADVVRWLPQTASLYAAIGLPVNLRGGLIFANVKTARETEDGVDVLTVEGAVVNEGKRAVEVPRLRFSVRNQHGHEVHSWTALPSRNVLFPGEGLAFRSHLASPPDDSDRVLVRFFSRRDLVAETK